MTVTATTVPTGISITGITNTNGTMTATVVAGCNAATGDNTVVLTASDGTLMTTANFIVTVLANTAPTVGTYANTTLTPNGSTTVTPNAAPADNGTIASVTATASAGFTGTLGAGNTTTGAIPISNAGPAGMYTLTVTVTDNCGASVRKTFTLTVNAPPTITAGATATRQQGTAGSTATIATVSDDLTAAGSIVVTATTVPAGITVTGISNSSGITATVAVDCTATSGNNTVVLTATDGNGATTTANLIVSVTANTAPTVGTYANTTLAPNGSTTVTPTAAPADNGTIASVTATASPNTFTGTFSGNTTTGAVTITNAAPAGTYTITVTVTDNCGATVQQTFTLTLITPEIKAEIGDPFVCNGIGSSILVTAQLTNPSASAQPATFNVTLPAPLTVVPGTCTASIGACSPAPPTQIAWSGTIPAGQTVTFTYQAQIADGTPDGTVITITSTGTVAGIGVMTSATGTVSCPGLTHEPEDVKISDQKAGSVLVFPYYLSKSGSGSDTKLHLSNTGEVAAFVHLFFIDGATCNQADYSVCLTPNASINFLASEMDPDTTGWLLAVAVDAQGNPIQNNGLIGNAFVNDSPYIGNYGAESFWAYSNNLATINGDKATLRFNGTSYDAMPNQFAVEVQSPRDITGQKVVTVGLSGDLTTGTLTGAAQVGTGVVYNGNEKPFGSFVGFLTGKCQATGTITNTIPRVPFSMAGIIPSGQVGTIKLNIGGGVGLLLTPQNVKKWSGIRGLHKTGITFTTITIPVLPPKC